MDPLVKIKGQEFHTVALNEVSVSCSHTNRCVVVIDESDLVAFVENGMENILTSVNQIIIISKNLNSARTLFEGINVLLISVQNLEEAMKVSVMGEGYSKEVAYVTNEDSSEWQRLVEMLVD